jgi:hypothetical protein
MAPAISSGAVAAGNPTISSSSGSLSVIAISASTGSAGR